MNKISIIFLTLLMSGCLENNEAVTPDANLQDSSTEILDFKVSPYKVDCVGVAPMKCLVVNDDLFYDHIVNFDFEEGYEYQLKVERIQKFTENTAPADAGLYEFKLLEVIAKINVPL